MLLLCPLASNGANEQDRESHESATLSDISSTEEVKSDESNSANTENILTLTDCFNLLYEHSIEIQSSETSLNIQRREFGKVLNKFNMGLEAGYKTSSSQSGGSSADSQLFGTSQTRDTMNIGFNQPLETGGSVGLNYVQSQNETNSSFGDPVTFGSSLGLSWFQPLFKSRGRSVALYEQYSQQLNLAQKMLEAENEIIAIRFSMITNFLDCMSTQEEVKILELSSKTNEQILNVSRARKKAGLTTKLDVLESELQYKMSLSNLRRGIGQRDIALNNLARSLGTPIEKGTKVGYDLNFVTGSPDFNESRNKAMNNRNDAEIKKLQIKSIELDKDFRHNQLEPDIELVSSLNYSGEGTTKSDGSSLDNKSYSVGIAYTTRFGRRDETIDFGILTERVKLANLAYKQLEQDVTLEVANNLQALKDTEDLVKLTDDEKVLAEEKFKFIKIAYENQLRILSDVLDTERQLTETRARYIKSLIAHLTARLNLVKSEGSSLTLKDIQEIQKKGSQ
jgi:outer membrane protein TolC